MIQFQLDTDGDGQLSFDEFKVLFANADKRKKKTQKQETAALPDTTKVGDQTKPGYFKHIVVFAFFGGCGLASSQ